MSKLHMQKQKDEIGQRIRSVRKEFRLSQMDVGELTNTHYRTISDYENGKMFPNIKFVKNFCEEFSTDPSWLLEIDWDVPYE